MFIERNRSFIKSKRINAILGINRNDKLPIMVKLCVVIKPVFCYMKLRENTILGEQNGILIWHKKRIH